MRSPSPVPLAVLACVACTGTLPANLGIGPTGLAPCPPSPNCVSSDAVDDRHRIATFELTTDPESAWHAVREAVASLPRTRVVHEAPGYLRAECRSALFGFVDDLELYLRPEERRITVRSASRVGRSDLGVNRRRVETLRATLAAGGVLRQRPTHSGRTGAALRLPPRLTRAAPSESRRPWAS